jgi:hypothetical protein
MSIIKLEGVSVSFKETSGDVIVIIPKYFVILFVNNCDIFPLRPLRILCVYINGDKFSFTDLRKLIW